MTGADRDKPNGDKPNGDGPNGDKPKHQLAFDAIRRHLDADALAEADAALADALERWPQQMRLHLLKGELLERQGETDTAHRHYLAVQQSFPDAPWPNVPLMRLLAKSGRRREARDLFAEKLWPSAIPDKIKNALLHELTREAEDPDDALAFLEAFCEADPHPIPLVLLAGARMKRHIPDAALEALEQAVEHAGDEADLPDHAQTMLLDLRIVSHRLDTALPLAERLYENNPDQPELAGKLVRILSELGRAEEAADVLDAALDRWPGDLQLIRRYNRMFLPPDRDAALFAKLAAAAGDPDADPRWLFQYALACLPPGRVDAALATLRGLREDPIAGSLARPLEEALASRPPSGWRPREGFSDDRGRDLQVVRETGAETTVIVFAGLMGRLSYLPFSCADALLTGRPANVVYLRDRRARAYLTGIAGLGESEAETLEGLRRLLRDLGGSRLITLGASMGGYAAMRYAALLGADAAISLDGPTTIDSVSGSETVESGVSPRFDGFMRLARTALLRDLGDRPGLADCIAAAPATRIHHCYGADFSAETAAAERLRGFSNVRLIPVSGVSDHFVGLHMIARGEFDGLLDDVVGPGVVGSAAHA